MTCKCCEKALRKTNKSGLCTTHYLLLKKNKTADLSVEIGGI